MSTRAEYQPRSVARKISVADVCHQRGIAICHQQSKTESEAVLDDTAVVDQGGISTAISKAEKYLAQTYITSVV